MIPVPLLLAAVLAQWTPLVPRVPSGGHGMIPAPTTPPALLLTAVLAYGPRSCRVLPPEATA